MHRMYVEREDVFYYITLMNQNYKHPAMPQREGIEQQILKGMYLLQEGTGGKQKVQLMGSGVILQEVIAAAELLKQDFDVDANIWSVTSFNELYRDGIDIERYNRLHPTDTQKVPYVTQLLSSHEGPVVASTDYVRHFADRIRAYVPQDIFTVLGTDGFGRSDSRDNLREFFEVNRYHVAVAALNGLADEGKISKQVVQDAISKYGIKADVEPSWTR
jgi:pyruvate dehydrogenase E1 component